MFYQMIYSFFGRVYSFVWSLVEWDLKDRTRLAKEVAPLAQCCAVVISRLSWQARAAEEPQEPGFYLLQGEDQVDDEGSGLSKAVRAGNYSGRHDSLVKGAPLVDLKFGRFQYRV